MHSSPLSSRTNYPKSYSRRQRRQIRHRRRRQQYPMKILKPTTSMTTQIISDAFNLLHISTESNRKSAEFIERYELTRQETLNIPFDHRSILFVNEHRNKELFPTTIKELNDTIHDDDDHLSYV
ncbi:unnamed protein product [Rotaria socialis]